MLENLRPIRNDIIIEYPRRPVANYERPGPTIQHEEIMPCQNVTCDVKIEVVWLQETHGDITRYKKTDPWCIMWYSAPFYINEKCECCGHNNSFQVA